MKKKMKIAYKDITGEQHVQQAPAHEWMIHSDMNMLASNFGVGKR